MPILATPSLVPVAPGRLVAEGTSHLWTGWDGSEWDLSGLGSGVSLGSGVRGLTMPPVQRFSTDSPGVAGSRWRGFRTQEREVFWPLRVYHEAKSQEWIEYDRALWATMHPARTGVWTVTHPDGSSRSLTLRCVDDGSHAFDTDPALLGWARYAVTLVAEQPYWEGEPLTRSWKTVDPKPFFGGVVGGKGPTFYISSGSTLGNATMDNPGDVDAWPVWTIYGPTSSVSVGVGGKLVTVPFAIADGDSLTIDTRPSAQTAFTAAGVEMTSQLSAFNFAPVPSGQSVPLSLSMVGNGVVQAALTPLHLRAW